MSRYREDNAKSIIPIMLLDLAATEVAVVLSGRHHHLLSMLVEELIYSHSSSVYAHSGCLCFWAIAPSVAERSYTLAGIMDLASPSVCLALDTVIFQFCAVTYNYEV